MEPDEAVLWIQIWIKLKGQDPDPDQCDKLDPDPHQSDRLDPDKDPHQFAGDKLKGMEYERI